MLSQDKGLLTGDHTDCHLDYFHKDTPGPEPDGFTECHPWKPSACCAHATVLSAQTLKEGYGPEYHWDRCGPLSQECERFFVQEACFYECDPNAGLFRKWNSTVYDPKCDQYNAAYDETYANAQGCSHNAWQMHKMPIKASYCDAWLTACAQDLFCASDSGDYFTCAAEYQEVDQLANLEQQLNDEKNKGLDTMIIILIVALGALVFFALCGVIWLICREKSGRPVFTKQVDELPKNDAAPVETYGTSL